VTAAGGSTKPPAYRVTLLCSPDARRQGLRARRQFEFRNPHGGGPVNDRLQLVATSAGVCRCGLPAAPPHRSGHLLWWWWTDRDPDPGQQVHAVAWRGDDRPAERCWLRLPGGTHWELSGSQVTHRQRCEWPDVSTCSHGNQHAVIEVDESDLRAG
jgi:hypothetical protein